ncbi:hypothetical protein [Microtetraspora sp. NBRC 16547]|uniref:hypothetical protein n=1 Tax=Microtetraspora sp. NBRC 16547 TaxID=3030993 RepID=UPI0024A211B6|nr:hypothetical protein [Microtetraspora sp. NBRC 16547]GLX01197.1 hypothetical protein Misp02_52830 [Microtetraspora sp. NBRC 16547]
MISPRPSALALALAASLTLTLTACSSGENPSSSGSGSDGSAGGSASSPNAAPGLTPEAYQVELDAAGRPVADALRDISKARTLKSLGQRVQRAQKAVATAADRLGPLRPPAEIGTEHADYLAALRAMDGRLDEVGQAVDGRSLCTASSVLSRLGKSREFGDLKEAGADLAGGGDYRGGLVEFTPPKERNRRLGNGTILVSSIRGGRGGLTVKNGTAGDSVVTLVLGKRKAVSVYVRKKSTAKVSNIKDGKYRVFFTSGVDYDRAARSFTRNCTFQKFDDPLPYKTVYTATQIRWDDWTLTLNKVVGGNASTSDVSPDDFPA